MSALSNPSDSKESMTTMDAIYRRRAVRDYKPEKIAPPTINALLDAAVHAPTAMHGEPWSFVVVQDKVVLDCLSEDAKEHVLKEKAGQTSEQARHMVDYVSDPKFHIFYNASTLIVICSKDPEATGAADGWLAAQNLMLAACAKGLGTCVIGFAIGVLNTPKWKAELKIPDGTTIIAPIIVGAPAGETPATSRKPPEVLIWK
ncbi:MAG: nitroreductase [Bdellovibrionales bacterium]